jgi:hypothetical protein
MEVDGSLDDGRAPKTCAAPPRLTDARPAAARFGMTVVDALDTMLVLGMHE